MKKLSKRITSLVLSLTLCVSSGISAMAYEPNHAQLKAEALKQLNLFQGTDKGFELEKTPTRIEALIMLIRMTGKENAAIYGEWEHPFTDAPTWENADQYIGYAYENGLTSGVSATKFNPTATANAQTYATFMLRALGYEDSSSSTIWNNWKDLSDKAGILPDDVNTTNFKRGDVVLMSYASLDASMKSGDGTLKEKLINDGVFNNLSLSVSRIMMGEPVSVYSPLSLIMGKVYSDIEDGLNVNRLAETELTKDNVESFLGVKDLEFIEGIAVEPMMSSTPHSIALVRVPEGSNIEKIKKDIKENVNPAKWICVAVDPANIRVENIGNLILLVMDNQTPDEFVANFRQVSTTAKPDKNGMMLIGDTYVEAGTAVNEESVTKFAEKLETLRKDFFPNNNVWYSVIPDKSYYAKDFTTSYTDHDAMMKSLKSKLSNWNNIEFSDLLTLDNFYLTDPHWKQEDILPIVSRLGKEMGFTVDAKSFTEKNHDDFTGSYKKYLYTPVSESLSWLENPYTTKATVENFQQPGKSSVYDLTKLSTNPYDVFLSGATPLTVINNPDAKENRELVIFRDSFGSSIAPLMLESYSKVTLVDLRYMMSKFLPEYVDFTNADVLFLYGSRIVNNSSILK